MLLHFLFGDVNFLFQFPGGHPKHTAAEGAQLHQGIGGGDPDGIVAADFIRQSLDVLVGGDTLLGVDHLDVVQLPLFADAALVLVAVEELL